MKNRKFVIDIIPQHSLRLGEPEDNIPGYKSKKVNFHFGNVTTNSDVVYAYNILLNGEYINVTATYEQAELVAESLTNLLNNEKLLEDISNFIFEMEE